MMSGPGCRCEHHQSGRRRSWLRQEFCQRQCTGRHPKTPPPWLRHPWQLLIHPHIDIYTTHRNRNKADIVPLPICNYKFRLQWAEQTTNGPKYSMKKWIFSLPFRLLSVTMYFVADLCIIGFFNMGGCWFGRIFGDGSLFCHGPA